EGDFSSRAVVDLVSQQGRRIGRGLVQYHASDLQRIAGRRSHEIEDVLGFHNGSTVIRRDDLVLLDHSAATPH
ncbi:MAG: glutamate 5-kinase, partial [Gammaproteobacteria bacterium]|nr:glutamate 5-kinase [Gammaproteobacteria bacterium]